MEEYHFDLETKKAIDGHEDDFDYDLMEDDDSYLFEWRDEYNQNGYDVYESNNPKIVVKYYFLLVQIRIRK